MGVSTRGRGTGVMTEGQEEAGDEDDDEEEEEGGVCRGERRCVGGDVLDLLVERSTGSVWV